PTLQLRIPVLHQLALHITRSLLLRLLFFFNDTATTEIYTLSLHDALPIWPTAGQPRQSLWSHQSGQFPAQGGLDQRAGDYSHSLDRKSTRLNSSHVAISYAVFCLKKKKSQSDPHPHILEFRQLGHPSLLLH